MPLDDRVRNSLERASHIVEPDIRQDLASVRRKTRRLVLRQRIGYTLVAAALIVSAVFLAPKVLDVIRNQRQTPATEPVPAALAGTYEVDLSGSGPLTDERLAGPWTITINGDGSIIWTAPRGAGAREGLPRDTFHADGGTIVTNMFASSLCRGKGVGTYTWVVNDGTLSFVTVNDGCRSRRGVLTSAAWTPG
jgi:hypothetical protein